MKIVTCELKTNQIKKKCRQMPFQLTTPKKSLIYTSSSYSKNRKSVRFANLNFNINLSMMCVSINYLIINTNLKTKSWSKLFECFLNKMNRKKSFLNICYLLSLKSALIALTTTASSLKKHEEKYLLSKKSWKALYPNPPCKIQNNFFFWEIKITLRIKPCLPWWY